MSAVRNVGEGLVEKIVAERVGRPYVDFYDYCERVDPQCLNKRTVESLIKSGAFDAMGHHRKGLCMVFEQIVDRTLARRREHDQGIMSLFGGGEMGEPSFDDARILIPEVEFDKMQRLAFEKEMLGLYVSDHPLLGVEAALRRHAESTITDLREQREGEIRTVAGVVTNLNRRFTKKGDLMATFVLEDLQAAVDVFVFPRVMQEWGALLVDDAIVCIKGRLDLRDDQPKLTCLEVKRPDVTVDGGQPLRLAVPVGALTASALDELKALLADHPGESPVFLHVGDKVLRLAEEFNVEARNGLVAELRVLLGPDCIAGPAPSSVVG